MRLIAAGLRGTSSLLSSASKSLRGAGLFSFLEVSRGLDQRFSPPVLAGLMPMLLDLPGGVLEACRVTLDTCFAANHVIPTVAPGTSVFDPRRYWRGPVWVNMNWLLIPRIGASLADATLDLVKQAGFREYFDPNTGEGLGAKAFTWTAALTLDLALTGVLVGGRV